LVKDDIVDVVQVYRLPAPRSENQENLFWAFGYNTLAIPFGMGVLYPFIAQMVSPELAALLMAFSSVSVTLNTLRMRGFVPEIRRAGGKSMAVKTPGFETERTK